MDMFVKPKKGLKILRPDTRTVLSEVGEHVPKTSFWLRRLKQGDVSVERLDAPKPEAKKEPIKAEPEKVVSKKKKHKEFKTEGE